MSLTRALLSSVLAFVLVAGVEARGQSDVPPRDHWSARWPNQSPAELPAEAGQPYEIVARDFLSAIQNGEYASAVKLRASTYYDALRPVVIARPGCTAAEAAITTDVVVIADDYADVLARLSFRCGGSSEPLRRERLIRLVPERGTWKVALNRSVELQIAQELLAAPADEGRRVFAEFGEPTRVAIADALLDACDDWIAAGQLESVAGGLALLDESCSHLDASVVARTAVLAAKMESYHGRFTDALRSLRAAIGNCEAAADAGCSALARNELALVYIRQAKLDDAETEMRAALDLCEALGNKSGIATVLSGLGMLASQRGRYAEAQTFYSRCSRLRHEIGDMHGAAAVLSETGQLFAARDDITSALQYLDHAAKLFERVGNRRRLAATLLNIGIVYRNQNNHRLGLDIARRSYDAFCEVDDRYNTAIALREIGADYAGLGDWRQAVRYLDQSIAVGLESGFTENTGLALQEMAAAFSIAGLHDQALGCLYEAYDEERRDAVPAILGEIASELAATGAHEEALAYAERAARIARELGKPRDVARARAVAAAACTRLGKLPDAELAYREAIETTETLRLTAGGGERAQAQFMGDKLSAYHGITRLLVAQGKDEDALRYAEQAKGRVLVDVLRGGRARVTKAMTPARQEEERRLREALSHANLQLADAAYGSTEETLARLRRQVSDARLAYEQFVATLFNESPQTKLQRGALGATTSEIVADIVRDEAIAIIEYTRTPDGVIASVVRRRGSAVKVTSRLLPLPAQELSANVAAFVSAVASKDLRFVAASRSLYESVLAPLARDIDGAKHLIVIPDGPLWSLPFEALRDSVGAYLIEQADVTYAPSIAAYAAMARSRDARARSAPRSILALGNPGASPAAGDETREPGVAFLRADPLAPLPDSETEVRRIVALYGGNTSRMYVGANASEKRIRDEAGTYDVVHIATHAVTDAENPMYSYLMLSPERAGRDDGRLEAWEIANLELRADLVVLSACETARGQFLDGEGIIGLSWAWFLAGAPAAVLSRWKVDSAATAELMVSFYENLGRDDAAEAVALREAAIRMLRGKRYRHPFYWAAFQMIGAGQRGGR